MKTFFSKIHAILVTALSAVVRVVVPSDIDFRILSGMQKVGAVNFFVQLSRQYAGYPVGQIVGLNPSTESSLVASGGATFNTGPVTPGNVFTTENSGVVGVAAGQSSVTVTSPGIKAQTKVFAQIRGTATDATATSIQRVNPVDGANGGPGSVTIALNANATAQVSIDWAILNPNGSLSNPQ